jgi:outer membrane protein assembly factor BamB
LKRGRPFLIAGFLLLVILLAGSNQAAASPANWPMYRNNPLHTGVASDVVSPPLNLKWKQTFGGAVDSSPAVVGSRLYVGSDDKNLYAIDTATGNIIWTFNDPVGGVGTTLAWDSSPTVATVGNQTVIFAGNDNKNLYAVRDDGTVPFKLWAYTTGGPVKSSPVVTTIAGTQVVIFGSEDKNLYALVASTGALYGGWTPNPFVAAGLVETSPAILGQTVFFGSAVANGPLYAVNLGNGVKLWDSTTTALLPGATGLIYSSPAVANVVVGGVPTDLVFFGADDKNLYALVAASGVKQWSFAVGGKIDSSPAVAVIPNPPAACAPGPTLAVIFGSADNNLYAVRASDGTPCWTFPSTGAKPFYSSPTVSGQTVYVGSDDNNVYAVDINTGAWRWSYPAMAPVGAAIVGPNPVISGTTLYVGSTDHSLYAFESMTVTASATQTVTISTTTVTASTTQTVTASTTTNTATISTGTTQTQTTTQTLTSTVIASTVTVPPSPVPGFPIESILAGMVAGLAALSFLRHKHRRREARSGED